MLPDNDSGNNFTSVLITMQCPMHISRRIKMKNPENRTEVETELC